MTNITHLVILDKSHWMLYFLVTAMYPRFMITLDENLESMPVTVRVGQVRILTPHKVRIETNVIIRLSTLSVWQVNHVQSLASRHTSHLFDWVRPNALSWEPRSIFHMRQYWRALSFLKRILAMLTSQRWKCEHGQYCNNSFFSNIFSGCTLEDDVSPLSDIDIEGHSKFWI